MSPQTQLGLDICASCLSPYLAYQGSLVQGGLGEIARFMMGNGLLAGDHSSVCYRPSPYSVLRRSAHTWPALP